MPTGWHRYVFDNPVPITAAGVPGPPAGGRAESIGMTPPAEAGGRHRRQVGRVLDDMPRRRRPTVVVAGALFAVIAAAVVAVLVLSTTSGSPAEPPSAPATRPEPRTTVVPTTIATPTLTGDTGAPTSGSAPAGGPGPAVVSTLPPGDPGFGWPSTAFGSAPGR
ncbi:MAG TPA: hypothetical protein VIU11_14845 [Nakamurella sp.]